MQQQSSIQQQLCMKQNAAAIITHAVTITDVAVTTMQAAAIVHAKVTNTHAVIIMHTRTLVHALEVYSSHHTEMRKNAIVLCL